MVNSDTASRPDLRTGCMMAVEQRRRTTPRNSCIKAPIVDVSFMILDFSSKWLVINYFADYGKSATLRYTGYKIAQQESGKDVLNKVPCNVFVNPTNCLNMQYFSPISP